ncbi:cytochrome P450 [Sphingomonas oryzagri]
MMDAHAQAPSLLRMLDPAVHADPVPFYRDLLDRGPVVWDPYAHTWIVTGYAEVVRVFQDFLSRRTPSAETFAAMGLPAMMPVADILAEQMMFMDQPDHMKLRAICASAFSLKRIQALRGRMESLCRQLLSTMRDGEPWDLLAGYCDPLPPIIAAEIIGFPTADWEQLREWSNSFGDMLGNFHQHPKQAEATVAAIAALEEYVARQIHEQRRRPRDGLLHALMTATDEDTPLSDRRILANIVIIMVAGTGAMTDFINSSLYALISNPSVMRDLRLHPEIMDSAIEELLRIVSPSQMAGRIAPCDTDLGGCRIAKGDPVMAMIAAANRDPAVFADPDRIDLRRHPNKHLSFAWGSHFCFGASLARLEAHVAFTMLLERTSGLELGEGPIEWRPNIGLRGLTSLPVIPHI